MSGDFEVYKDIKKGNFWVKAFGKVKKGVVVKNKPVADEKESDESLKNKETRIIGLEKIISYFENNAMLTPDQQKEYLKLKESI